jgi:uncharacterized protein YuzE
MAKKEFFKQIAVSYDKDADVLYMSEGEKPRASICNMLDNGVIVRKDSKTKEITGFTIVDFASHFNKAKPQFIPIAARFSLLQKA